MKPLNRSKLISLYRKIPLLALALAASVSQANAQTWTPTAAGTFAWNDNGNWSASPFPNAVDATANLNINLAGNQTINLNEAITLGTLNIGDNTTSFFTTTVAPNSGSLIFDVTSGNATISKATASNNVVDTISAPIQLNDNLIVTSASTTSNSLTISGAISESGGAKSITKNGAGVLRLSGSNSYTGGTTLNAGTLTLSNGAALGSETLTINGGSLTVNNGAFTSNNSIVANANFSMGGGNAANTGNGTFKISQPITISGGGGNDAGNSEGITISNVVTDSLGGNTLNALDLNLVVSGSTAAFTLGAPITLRSNQTFTSTVGHVTSNIIIKGAIGQSSAGQGVTFAGTGTTPTGAIGRGPGVILMGTNTYTGATTINSGVTVVLGRNTSGSLSPSSSIVNNGTFVFARSDTNTQGTHFGTISGGGQVMQSSGTTTLTGTNTYTGSTVLYGGTLVADSTAALGSGTLTFGGGTFRFATGSSLDFSRRVLMTGNGTVDASLASGTISGMITGTGNLTKTGTNNLTLSGINQFTGDTTISGGKIILGNALALQMSTYNTAGSTGTIGLDFNSLTTPTLGGLSGSVALATGTTGFGSLTSLTLNPQSGKTPSYSGVIGDGAGSLALIKDGAGTQTLTGANTFAGGITIKNGTLVADTATNATVLQTAGLNFAGTGTFQLKGLASNARSQSFSGLTLTRGAATIDANNVGTSTTINLAGITRTAGATVDFRASSGTFGTNALVNTTQGNDASGIMGPWATVGGANWATNNGSDLVVAYTGYTDVALGGTIADGTSTNVRINSGTTGNISLGATTTNINTLLQNHSTAATIDAASKTLRFGTNGGIMVGTGKQALTIGTAANSGAVTAGGDAADVAGELVLNNYANLTVNSTITNNGTGAVSVVKSGTGTATLAGTNSFSGGFTLNAGTVTPTHASALGTGKLTLNGGGITVNQLTLGAFTEIVMNGDWSARTGNSGAVLNTGTGPITLNAPVTIDVTNSVLTLGGTITGPGSANALDISIKRSDGQNASVNFTQGIVLRGNQVANLVPSVSNGGSFPNITYLGAISDGGNGYGMTFSSATTYNLDGGATFTGAININSGSTVRIAPGQSVASTSVTINTGGTLQLGNQNLGGSAATIPTGATLTNNGTFRLGDNTAYTQGTHFPNGISGSGSVVVSGTRASGVTLSGTNTYSGGTSVIYTGGGGPVVFNINSANAIGTGPLTLSQSGANAATIDNTSGGAVTLATNNVQSWNGPIIFTGSNALNLGTGAITLANNPTMTVSASTLTAGGALNGSAQTLTKAGAGTLALNGTTSLRNLVIGSNTAGGTMTLGNDVNYVLNVGATTGNAIQVSLSNSANNASGILTSDFLKNTSTITTADASAAAVLIGSKTSSGTSTGTLNLNGGAVTITTGGGAAIAGGGGTSTLNLDGNVTLKAGGTHSNWINSLTTAEIKSGGATIDTNTYDIGISQAFSGAGGLTKGGAGTLTLDGANSYAGATTVNAGTLKLGASASLNSASMELKIGTIFDTTAQSYTVPAAKPVTIHLDSAGDGSSGKIKAASLNITDATVVVEIDNETALDDPVYVLAEYTSLTGTEFSSVTAPPSGYVIDYAYDGGTKIAWVQDTGTDYDDWASIYDPADLSDPSADFDGDGLSNFQEYAFGLNPISAASSNPIGDVSQLKTNGIFTYSRRFNSGLTYTVWSSGDLQEWDDVTPVVTESQLSYDEETGIEVIEVGFAEPPTATNLFVRVKAEEPAN